MNKTSVNYNVLEFIDSTVAKTELQFCQILHWTENKVLEIETIALFQ